MGSGSGIVHVSKNAFGMLKKHKLVDKENLVKVFKELTEFFLCDHKVFLKVMKTLRRKGLVFREYMNSQRILSSFYKKESIVPLIPEPSVSAEAMERDMYSFDEAASMYWTANLGEFDSDEYLENMDMY